MAVHTPAEMTVIHNAVARELDHAAEALMNHEEGAVGMSLEETTNYFRLCHEVAKKYVNSSKAIRDALTKVAAVHRHYG